MSEKLLQGDDRVRDWSILTREYVDLLEFRERLWRVSREAKQLAEASNAQIDKLYFRTHAQLADTLSKVPSEHPLFTAIPAKPGKSFFPSGPPDRVINLCPYVRDLGEHRPFGWGRWDEGGYEFLVELEYEKARGQEPSIFVRRHHAFLTVGWSEIQPQIDFERLVHDIVELEPTAP